MQSNIDYKWMIYYIKKNKIEALNG